MGRWSAFLFFVLLVAPNAPACAKHWEVLSQEEKAVLHRILSYWETWMPEKKKEGTAPLLTFQELYAGLGEEEREFINRILSINPRKSFDFQGGYLGDPEKKPTFQRIDNQWIEKDGVRTAIDPQYLPRDVYLAYEEMMQAMEKDLGKRLLIESGYRSPAYQLYIFLYYLPKHNYSLVETGKWIALPGYSEHGAPHRQAIDFINQQGINGEDNPEEFEELPEYQWLQKNAARFGFELSYPRGNKGINFEPWHWRYIKGVGKD